MSVIGADARKHLSGHLDLKVSDLKLVTSIHAGSHKVCSMFLYASSVSEASTQFLKTNTKSKRRKQILKSIRGRVFFSRGQLITSRPANRRKVRIYSKNV